MAKRSSFLSNHRTYARRELHMQRSPRRAVTGRKRSRGDRTKAECQYLPPEDWHEPVTEPSPGYHIIQQKPGTGYMHVLTPVQVRERLSVLPAHFVVPLEVVQLSRMTRKKQSFPCYGMQWGNAIYLYPIEENLVEHFSRPPRPAEYTEARMYGGRWIQTGNVWKLLWTEAAIRDFYLNNVLIHELGHMLDDRNNSYRDRERYAEWFAIHHGYKPSRGKQTKTAKTR